MNCTCRKHAWDPRCPVHGGKQLKLDDVDPRDLGDGMEATVEPGDPMTEAELDAFISNRDPGDENDYRKETTSDA